MRMVYSTREFGSLYEWDVSFIRKALLMKALEGSPAYPEGSADQTEG